MTRKALYLIADPEGGWPVQDKGREAVDVCPQGDLCVGILCSIGEMSQGTQLRTGTQAGLSQLWMSLNVVHVRPEHDPKDTGVCQCPRQVGMPRGASHRVRRRIRIMPPSLAQRLFQCQVPILNEGNENSFSPLEVVIRSLVSAVRPAGNLAHRERSRPTTVEQVATNGEDRFP